MLYTNYWPRSSRLFESSKCFYSRSFSGFLHFVFQVHLFYFVVTFCYSPFGCKNIFFYCYLHFVDNKMFFWYFLGRGQNFNHTNTIPPSTKATWEAHENYFPPLSNYLAATAWSVKIFDRKLLKRGKVPYIYTIIYLLWRSARLSDNSRAVER